MDSKSRPMIKAITWRILALLITIIVCFVILSGWWVSVVIGILSTLLETLFHYIQERFCWKGKPNLVKEKATPWK